MKHSTTVITLFLWNFEPCFAAELFLYAASTPWAVFAACSRHPCIKHAIKISNRSLLLAIGCCLILDIFWNGVNPAPVSALMHMLRNGF